MEPGGDCVAAGRSIGPHAIPGEHISSYVEALTTPTKDAVEAVRITTDASVSVRDSCMTSAVDSAAAGSPSKRSELVQEIAVMLQKMHKQSELTLQALKNLYGLSQIPVEDNEGALNQIREQEERLAMRKQAAQQMLRGEQAVSSHHLPLLSPGTRAREALATANVEVQPERTPEQQSCLAVTATSVASSSSPTASPTGTAASEACAPAQEVSSARFGVMPEWTPEKELSGSDRLLVTQLSDFDREKTSGDTGPRVLPGSGKPLLAGPSRMNRTPQRCRPAPVSASSASVTSFASCTTSGGAFLSASPTSVTSAGSSTQASAIASLTAGTLGTATGSAAPSWWHSSSDSRQRSPSIREVAASPQRLSYVPLQERSSNSSSMAGNTQSFPSTASGNALVSPGSPARPRPISPLLQRSPNALARAAAATAAGAAAAVAAVTVPPSSSASAVVSRVLSPMPTRNQQPRNSPVSNIAQLLPSGSREPLSALPSASGSSTTGGPRFEFEAGSHTVAGLKKQCRDWVNQDMHLVLPVGSDRMFVAVFDGHGVNGHHSASLARSMFAEQAPALAYAGSLLETMFRNLFQNVQAALEAQGLARMSGTTATAALIDANAGTVSTAHVGDSRLLAALGPRVYFETADHIFDAEVERHCQECGGEVRRETVAGVSARRIFRRGEPGPGLTMSRSLGDAECHELGVVSEPTVHCNVPFWPGSTLVLASDGVWEKLSSERGAAVVANLGTQAAAKTLLEEAHREWPQEGDIDDITVVTVRLVGVSPPAATTSNLNSGSEATSLSGSLRSMVPAVLSSGSTGAPTGLPPPLTNGVRRSSPERPTPTGFSPGRYCVSPLKSSVHNAGPITSQDNLASRSAAAVEAAEQRLLAASASPLRSGCSPMRR